MANNRNTHVERATDKVIETIDRFIGGESVATVNVNVFQVVDRLIAKQHASTRLACLFFVAYSLSEPKWDFKSIPTGVRGKYGDKRLSNSLNSRYVTLFNNITAFAENLGTKGNVTNFNLTTDPRFKDFLSAFKSLKTPDRGLLFQYFCSRAADSVSIPKKLPPLPRNYLTFARAMSLFEILLKIKSEGHIQQFLVAAMLKIHRRRHNYEIRTHHPHASDKFDKTAGDVEEFDLNNNLVNAYEVTVRDDWKNRIHVFRDKMDSYGLQKYTIIASNVNKDVELTPAIRLARFLEGTERDIAVVDIQDFVKVFAAELSSAEIQASIEEMHAMLINQKLCGIKQHIDAFSEAVETWKEKDLS